MCAGQFTPRGLLLTGSDDTEVGHLLFFCCLLTFLTSSPLLTAPLQVRLWDLKSASPLVKTLTDNTSAVTSLALSDDLTYLLCGLDSGATLYSAEDKDRNWRVAELQEGVV